jgi:hypothetical protein
MERTPQSSTANAAAANSAPAPATPLDEVLARAPVKDRGSIQRHLAACDAEPDPRHAATWRRLALVMGTLAGTPLQTVALETTGHHATLFFIADGKYRMQVFTLEDRKDGLLAVYLPDVLEAAVKAKALSKKGDVYACGGTSKRPIEVVQIDASNTPDPPRHYKNLIGWNRKAIRLTIDLRGEADAEAHATTAEALLRLAAKQWIK